MTEWDRKVVQCRKQEKKQGMLSPLASAKLAVAFEDAKWFTAYLWRGGGGTKERMGLSGSEMKVGSVGALGTEVSPSFSRSRRGEAYQLTQMS